MTTERQSMGGAQGDGFAIVTPPREMSDADFLVWMAGYAEDHEPEGWPAVQMWEITRLVQIATQRTGEV